MSFLDKVAAIRNSLGLPPEAELKAPGVIAAAMPLMGIVPEPSWALPQMAQALVQALGLPFGETSAAAAAAATPPAAAPTAAQSAATRPRRGAAGKQPATSSERPKPVAIGCTVEEEGTSAAAASDQHSTNASPSEARQAPSSEPATTAPATATKTSSKAKASTTKASSKHNAFAEASDRLKQPTIFSMPNVSKKLIPKALANAVLSAADTAMPYEELERRAAVTVAADGKLPSELAPSQPPRTQWFCEDCTRSFDTAVGLRNHSKWCTPCRPRQRIDEPIEWKGDVTVSIAVSSSGEVSVQILINGSTLDQIQQDAAEQKAAATKAKAEREAEQARRQDERRRLREAAEAEQRHGSARRIQHSAKEKLHVIDFFDKNFAEARTGRKLETFEADPRSRGVGYAHASKWAKPAERRKIECAAGQEHAASLMRINTESKRKGKYVEMERQLFARFKERRARGRKCSARWFPFMARSIMRDKFQAHSSAFRASRGWMRRFFKRFSVVRRKRTNNKNTTWEETKSKLQRYFCAFRRRLRDTAWRCAREKAVAAARIRQPATTAATTTDEPATTTDEPDGAEGDELRHRMRERWDASFRRVRLALEVGADGISAALSTTAPPAPSPRACDDEVAAADGEPETPWWDRERGKWGKYLPHQRFNKDQVPLPFIFDMDYTYEEKGAKRVAINQLGPALGKRQCTAEVIFRAEPPPPPPPDAPPEVKLKYYDNVMKQPPPCLIFRGTGARISQAELDAYPTELVVLWQPKAWADRPTTVACIEKCYSKIIKADIAAGVVDDSTRYLMIADNLDAQDAVRNPPYITALDKCQTDDHKVPGGYTDQVQPVDRGKGRHIKIYMGEEEDAWLEDDDNLQKYENNELTASDRRILIAQWYCKAYHRSNKGESNRKYFEHTGALLTADGSGDDLIKLEGVPRGETFTWEDDVLDTAAELEMQECEPADVVPVREDVRTREADDENHDEMMLDEEDEPDEDDAPPAPKEAPAGFRIVTTAPSEEQLAFTKEASPADALVGCSILFNWPVVGWCLGTIKERNTDARRYKMVEGERAKVNFIIHYEIDDQEVKTVLRSEEYGGDEEGAWVLLEPVDAEV